MDHWQTQRASQVGRLVESSAEATPVMKRNRYRAGGAREQIASGLTHQATEPHRQRPSPVVLERVHDVAKAALVPSGGPGDIDRARSSPARRSQVARLVQRAPRHRRGAARSTAGGPEEIDAGPARPTDRTHRRSVERRRTGGTVGGQYGCQQRVRHAGQRATKVTKAEVATKATKSLVATKVTKSQGLRPLAAELVPPGVAP